MDEIIIEPTVTTEEPESGKKLHMAVSALIDSTSIAVNNIWSNNVLPDKMEISNDYYKQVAMCRFFYSRDPIVSGAINKQVELAFNGYKPKRRKCSDEEFAVYSAINDTILDSLKGMALEFLTSGLIVPEIGWKRVTGGELGLKNRRNRSYYVPDYIWLRAPENLVLKPSPIPTKVRLFVKVSSEDVTFIRSKGVYSDGTKDTELYDQIVRDYPEYVQMILDGKTEIPLNDHFVIRRKVVSTGLFPTPYLLPALESLVHKRNLKKMDYSIASRVISAIQLVQLGDKDFPLTEDDSDAMEDLKKQMTWRTTQSNMERVFQLFGNHTLKISWVYPDTAALLDDTKYISVNEDILHALGIPKIITVGETGRSATSQAEFALLPPAEVLKSLRNDLAPFVKELYKQIQERNHFTEVPAVGFAPIKLYDPEKISKVGETLFNNGALSPQTWDEISGFDIEYENEQELRKAAEEITKKLGIEPTPQVPFSSPSIGGKGGDGNTPKPAPTKSKAGENN